MTTMTQEQINLWEARRIVRQCGPNNPRMAHGIFADAARQFVRLGNTDAARAMGRMARAIIAVASE